MNYIVEHTCGECPLKGNDITCPSWPRPDDSRECNPRSMWRTAEMHKALLVDACEEALQLVKELMVEDDELAEYYDKVEDQLREAIDKAKNG